MKNISFYKIPKLHRIYKVTEDCCYEVVVYDGPEIGVTAKNDEDGDQLNSYDLLCYDCNPGMEIIPIAEEEYYQKLRMVNEKRAA